MSRDLLIFPCNGNGLEALDCLGNDWQLLGFVDDTPEKQASGAYGHRVMPRATLAASASDKAPATATVDTLAMARVLAVPGGPLSYKQRRQVIEGLGIEPARFATVIHPRASVSPLAKIGHNVLVMAGAVVTSNAVIGNHVCVLPNTVIHHDVTIGDWTLIGSNVTIAGSVSVGENCYIGSGTSIKNGLRIGAGVLIGIGSNVIRDVASEARVVGNPAKPLP